MTFVLGFSSHTGHVPSPFDGLDAHRLAGSEGSHPLHGVDPATLIHLSDGPLEGRIVVDAPRVRVGETISGRIELQTTSAIDARQAHLRLLGLRLVEERKSEQHFDGQGHPTSRESWVEANGTLFETSAFTEPVIPTRLAAGEPWQGSFEIPAPPLGPPTAHLGEAIVAWAIDVRFDMAWHEDPFIAAFLPVDQHPDLLRAGVGDQGGDGLLETVEVTGGSIRIASPLPAAVGVPVQVEATWPSVPSGEGGRIELHRRTNAPNGVEGIIASADASLDELRSGSARATFSLPDGSAPSFDGAGLEIRYVIRVLVDRRFRADSAIERPLSVT